MLIPEELAERAERFPDRVAVRVDGGGSMTFGDWDGRASAVARGLERAGVDKGDRVALLMPNDAALEFCAAYVAVHRAGAVAVPVNPRYARREVDHIVSDCEPRLVLGPDDVGALETGDRTPFQVDVGPDDLADIFYTSGTTGLPRGVASTHANAAFHSVRPMEGGGVFLHAMPLSTFTGVHGAQLTPMRLAVTAAVLPRFDTTRFAELIESQAANWVLMVPAQILLLRESGALGGRDTSSVLAVMFGGAPTPPDAVEWLAETFPNAVLLNGYGLTEGGASVCVLPPGEARRRPGSVGRPMPRVEVRIVGDDGVDRPAGEVGEILLKVPAGDRRYYRDPNATARTWQEGWVHTGDLGRLDGEGFLYVVDRKKDMIIRGGYNVYSVEVEDALHELPDVAEAAVVGIPHPVLGQDVCAVVRVRAGAPAPALDAVRGALADRLADYKLPRRLVVRAEALPRTAMGKVDKKALLEELT